MIDDEKMAVDHKKWKKISFSEGTLNSIEIIWW